MRNNLDWLDKKLLEIYKEFLEKDDALWFCVEKEKILFLIIELYDKGWFEINEKSIC